MVSTSLCLCKFILYFDEAIRKLSYFELKFHAMQIFLEFYLRCSVLCVTKCNY